jgi:F0F1-type ATP synthase beta subunit
MENGGWDLSKVDTGMRVKSYFRFRTNEPGARARVALSGFIAEYFRDGAGTDQGKDVLFSLITSSCLHKQVLRFRHFWVVCHLQ